MSISSGEAHADDNEQPLSGRVGPESRALIPAEAVRTEIMVPGEPGGGGDAGIDQRALLGALRRQWFPAVSVGLITGLIAAGVAWAVVPITYTAYSELLVKSVPTRLIFDNMQESRAQFEVYRQTQSRMVKSPFVLSAALRDPEIARLNILRDEPYPFEWLEKNLQISNPATEFLRVSLSGSDPKEVTKIVNAVTTEYVNEVVNSENNARTKRISELEKAHHDLGEQLRTRRAALKKLVTNLQTGDKEALTEKQKMMIELHSAYRRDRAQRHFELMTARIRLAASEDGKRPDEDVEIPDIIIETHFAENAEIKAAESDITRKKKYLSDNEKASKGKDHPRLVGFRNDVEAAENTLQLLKTKLRPQIVERIRAETRGKSQVSAAQLRETIRLTELTIKQLDEEMEKQKIETQQTGQWSLEVETLREDLEQAKNIDQRLTEETERLKIELKADSRVVLYRPAEAPNAPDNQKRFKIVGAAGLGTMGLLFAGIVWFDVRTRRINSLDEVATGLRLPILGSLPTVPRHAANGKSKTAIAKADIWQGSLMESIDSARVMLLRRAELEHAKVAMVVSAMMSEGKTTLSCHLATSLARAGHRTLLVDTDIRRPTVHRVFDMPCEPGMCEILRGEVPLADAIVPTPQDGLFLLPAGRLTQEALRELAQDALNPIMAQLREDYDFVIVDSSPILPVTDSLLVSQYVDGVIFSIRRDVSQYPKVATACQRLAMIGIPLWGAVVIGLDQTSYGYRYAYQYGATHSA
jgi:capsular exopolysaccharide synthesis family protein